MAGNPDHAPPTDATRSRPVVIGLAGGVGSGKSEVARRLAEQGCTVIDADRHAKEALDREDVRDTLAAWWGSGVLDETGRIDRRAVADVIFNDDAERRRLESVIHPIVGERRREMIAEATYRGDRAVVIDAPLLFEAGLARDCDAVIFVDAPRSVRLERVSRTRGWDEAELDRREAAQWPLDRKRASSDVVVENGGGPGDDLSRRVASTLATLLGQVRTGAGDEPRPRPSRPQS